MKPREFWIREKKLTADPFIGVDFYDFISREPFKNGIHVIEKSAYDELLRQYKEIHKAYMESGLKDSQTKLLRRR